MKLYLIRHGHAPTALEAGVRSDEERPLSEKGVLQAKRAGERLKERGCSPSVILSSPLERAMQTAGLVAGALSSEPRAYPPLANEIPGTELFERLLADGFDCPELVIVGHQPQLGEFAHHLTGASLELRPAGIIALETMADKPARILWTVQA
ncbi:MAG: phosphoglycerate mutase family protein [Elusimicrobiota bacterium]